MPLVAGDTAPNFSGEDILTNTNFSLDDHDWKCVIVAFHGVTWCPPCQFAYPLLQEVWEEYQADFAPVQFVVVSVNDDDLDSNSLSGITMPWLVDDAIASLYEVSNPPVYFFLGKDRVIRHIQVGLFSSDAEQQKDGIRQIIDDCLNDTEKSGFKFDRHWRAVAEILFGVSQDGGGVVISGGKPIPVPPWDPLKRDVLIALAVSELATRVNEKSSRYHITNGALDSIEISVKQMRENLKKDRTKKSAAGAVRKKLKK